MGMSCGRLDQLYYEITESGVIKINLMIMCQDNPNLCLIQNFALLLFDKHDLPLP
jgi:hypothetical protein